jgi:hypothetical protein
MAPTNERPDATRFAKKPMGPRRRLPAIAISANTPLRPSNSASKNVSATTFNQARVSNTGGALECLDCLDWPVCSYPNTRTPKGPISIPRLLGALLGALFPRSSGHCLFAPPLVTAVCGGGFPVLGTVRVGVPAPGLACGPPPLFVTLTAGIEPVVGGGEGCCGVGDGGVGLSVRVFIAGAGGDGGVGGVDEDEGVRVVITGAADGGGGVGGVEWVVTAGMGVRTGG